jgi:hypothetical protein
MSRVLSSHQIAVASLVVTQGVGINTNQLLVALALLSTQESGDGDGNEHSDDQTDRQNLYEREAILAVVGVVQENTQ